MSTVPQWECSYTSVRRSAALVARTLRAILIFAAVCASGLSPAAGLTYSWVGAASNLWSNQNNWNPVGVPSAGDNLAFPAGQPNSTQVNDLPPSTVFNILHFNGMGYRISGNAIGLTGGVSNGSGNTFDLQITLLG